MTKQEFAEYEKRAEIRRLKDIAKYQKQLDPFEPLRKEAIKYKTAEDFERMIKKYPELEKKYEKIYVEGVEFLAKAGSDFAGPTAPSTRAYNEFLRIGSILKGAEKVKDLKAFWKTQVAPG